MITEQYLDTVKTDHIQNIPESTLRFMYEMMLQIRLVEGKIADLVSQKKIICPCHLYEGQEAIAVGVCAALEREDYVFSTHRSHGHYLAKGGDLKGMMAELFGRVTGCSKGRGGSMHLVAPEIGFPGSSAIVAGTIPLSVGVALSFAIQKKDNVSVAFFGDGATCEGAFYESLNFASLKKLPAIFICENNFYSTHMPVSTIQANTDLYKRGEALNIPSSRIDGNNIIEVYQTAKAAIENARNGNGPALIECMTYRWRGHVGPNYDIDKGLREQSEVDWWMNNCPIKMFEELMLKEGIITASEKQHTIERIRQEVADAVAFAKEGPFPDPAENNKIKHVYK